MAVITPFAVDFAPKNWALCNGQLLPIAQNQALFSLLGTTYGGNGVNTFALPDLRGRRPVSTGQGLGLANYTLGEATGSDQVTLNLSNLPGHVHNGNVSLQIDCDSNEGTVPRATNTFPALLTNAYSANATPNPPPQPPAQQDQMAAPTYAVTIGNAGSNLPFNNLMPYLVVNYIICMYGLFPSRN